MNIFAANRISRLPYFLWMLAICVAVSLIQVFAGSHLSRDETSPVMSLVWMLAVGISAFPTIKRLHDLNKSGWLWLLGLIPLVNVFFGIYLLFSKGTEDSNDYGEPPENLLKKIRIGSPSTVSRSDDDALYQKAYEELENGQIEKALWAKIFTQCGGNENKAKAVYIRNRVEHLKSTNQQEEKDVADANSPNLQKAESEDANPTGIWLISLGVVIVLACIIIFSLREKRAAHYRDYSSFNTPSFSQKENVADSKERSNESLSSDTHLLLPTQTWVADLGGEVSMKFMPIPSGGFFADIYDEDWRVVKEILVMISRPFWMASTEVTQRQYQQIMGQNPSEFQGLDNPVERVSWKNAMIFCQRLTQQDRLSGRLPKGYEYTLPSAAQWEYACRTGSTNDFSSLSQPHLTGWCRESFRNMEPGPQPVGQLRPNSWGLYDMHGNVEEFCLDRTNWDGMRFRDGDIDPVGRSGLLGLAQGGNWTTPADGCNAGFSQDHLCAEKDGVVLDIGTVDQGLKNIGFRPVLSAVVAE
jgi:formylglycine-generating enzyme required for sulfatase activity/uncharacterized membrane protein YhaH (DUF805 family)